MKFSFNLIKKLAPGNYGKKELVRGLNLHSFEAVDLGGDVLEIAVTPNRFSDAASHLGIAREAAAIFRLKLKDILAGGFKFDCANSGVLKVNVKDKKLCQRYMAAYVDGVVVCPSPAWLKEVLETCGLRSINNVVDIMNYVMLEIGQPMHAFDADKVSGGLVVRLAKKGEKIETIDNQKIDLDDKILVIADAEIPLAIAGIKGGKSSEISFKSKRILVESAHFESANIYLTSKKIGLRTDASIRFSHDLSLAMPELGMRRALALLKELAGGKAYEPADVAVKKPGKNLAPFNPRLFSALIGKEIKENPALEILESLGFRKSGKMLEVPSLRTDINSLEDVAEEVIRIQGYDSLPMIPPQVAIGVAGEEEIILLKDLVRNFLVGAGISEVYNYSLVSEEDNGLAPFSGKPVKLANPMSKQTAELRDSLALGLMKNIEENRKFTAEVRIFEIGKVFRSEKGAVLESVSLGVALFSARGVLELKGLAAGLFERLGISDYFLPDLRSPCKILKDQESLRVETGGHRVIGYLGSLKNNAGALLELNLEKLLEEVDFEKEYEPLAKFPSIIRDLSIFVSSETRVGDILDLIQRVSSKLVNDVDLIDFYEPTPEKLRDRSISAEEKNKKSLTFRIVFQATDRTLTDVEVDKEMALINQVLVENFNAELR